MRVCPLPQNTTHPPRHSELFGDGTGDHTLLYIHSFENPKPPPPPHLKPADRRRVTDGNGTQSRLPRERHRSVERGFSRYLGSLYCMHYHGDYFVRISFVSSPNDTRHTRRRPTTMRPAEQGAGAEAGTSTRTCPSARGVTSL